MKKASNTGESILDHVRRTGKVRKRLRPDKTNRDEAVGLIAWGLSDADAVFRKNIAERPDSIAFIDKKNVGASSVSSTMDSFFSFGHGCNEVLKGNAHGWQIVREAFCVATYSQALCQRFSIESGINYSEMPMASGGGLIHLYSLALAGDAEELADWVGRYIYNYIWEGGMEDALGDYELKLFYWELLKAQYKREWPAVESINEEVGPFFDVLAKASGSEADFEHALIEYCDFRLSRAYGFESVDSTKARGSDKTQYQFQRQWFAIWPLELLAMQAVFRRCTGRSLSLNAEHPLLKTPLMTVPSMLPFAETDYSRRLHSLGRDVYGEKWQPWDSLDLV